MRKLAREAVIFTLLGAAAVGIAIFIVSIVNPFWWSNGAYTGFSESAVASVSIALLWGAPMGLSLWVLYRLLRFAVNG